MGGIGKQFLPMFKAARHSFDFFMVLVLFVLSVVQVYYTMGVCSETNSFNVAFSQISRLVLFGDFDLGELEGVSFYLVQILFGITAIAGIALMNALIGILVQAYDMEADRVDMTFIRHRAQIVSAAATRAQIVAAAATTIWSRQCPNRTDQKPLFFIRRKTPTSDQQRSLRSELRSMERRIGEKNEGLCGTVRRELKSKENGISNELMDIQAQTQEIGDQMNWVRTLRELFQNLRLSNELLRSDLRCMDARTSHELIKIQQQMLEIRTQMNSDTVPSETLLAMQDRCV